MPRQRELDLTLVRRRRYLEDSISDEFQSINYLQHWEQKTELLVEEKL